MDMGIKKCLASIVIAVLFIFSFLGASPAAAGSEDVSETPEAETPEAFQEDEEQPGAKFYTHPVVQMLSAYFDGDQGIEPDDPALEPTTGPGDEGGSDDVDNGLGLIGEEIAAYHAEGMGFGVLGKIYAMAEASESACADLEEDACQPMTADELVEAFKGGQEMGVLFKEYGKPALLGVGHVKQELREQEEASGDDVVITEEPPADETIQEETEGQDDDQGNRPPKDKKEKKDKKDKKDKDK